jgi:hypothetical protein
MTKRFAEARHPIRVKREVRRKHSSIEKTTHYACGHAQQASIVFSKGQAINARI